MRSAPDEPLCERAGGKVILIGEHAVLYGVPALACRLAAGVEVRAWPAASTTWTVDRRAIDAADVSPPVGAFRLAARALEIEGRAARFEVRSVLPPGMGLGWSASVSLATARLVARLCGRDAAGAETLADAMEQIFHGQASGIDLATVAARGVVRFQLRDGARDVDFLPHVPPGVAILAGAGPASTRGMIARVRDRVQRDPAVAAEVFGALTLLAGEIQAAMAERDGPRLGVAMSRAHREIGRLGVSTPDLDLRVRAAEEAGAWGAKLTGAGGGGCVLAVCDESIAAQVRAALEPGATFCAVAALGEEAPR